MEFRYFDIEDFACSETGENGIQPEFVAALDDLRHECGFPFVVTSGFRSKDHSIEKTKKVGGRHTRGDAADIQVTNGLQRMALVSKALEHGFKGIGVAKSFVHLDTRDSEPVMWTY